MVGSVLGWLGRRLHGLLHPYLVLAEHFQVLLLVLVTHVRNLLVGHGNTAFLGKFNNLQQGQLVEQSVGQHCKKFVLFFFSHFNLRLTERSI